MGSHTLRVNRVGFSNVPGALEIVRNGDTLQLKGSVEEKPYRLKISGKVIPKSEKEFVLEGTLEGIPDLSFKTKSLKEQITKGKFLFKATKKRQFWRLYRVDDKKCACGETCGNQFCYIDVSFKK